MPDELRLGPFAIERELGRGGMGVVYAASHEGRRVALKVSLDEVGERDRRHFLDEAELVARMSHPAIVGILGSGTFDDGRPYIVMPLLEGETLGARLARGRIAPERALPLWSELAGAVVALHDAGIVHRDIKPDNVMVVSADREAQDAEGRLVLLDFGIARDAERPASTTTRMNLVRGTPGCMAPERFFGVRASEASDVYELTVVLYAMLVGRLPWDDPTDPESRLRPRLPSEIGIDLPIGLGHILLEGLSTKPERRPTARDLAARVRAIEGAPLAGDAGGVGGDTALARVALPGMESPAPRARSIAPEATTASREGREAPRAAAWIGAAIGLAAIVVSSAVVVRARRAASPSVGAVGAPSTSASAEVESAQVTAPGATLTAPPSSDVPSAPATAVSEPTPNATANATPSAPAPPPTTAPRAPTNSTAVSAVAASPAPPPVGTPLIWCKRLAELYCTPAALRMSGGDVQCAAHRASAARIADLPDTTRARGEASCRDAIPAVERSIKTPQGSEVAEDMPWCKRVVAAYCSPEVRNSAGGEGLCAAGQNAWGARLQALPAAQRVAKNDECARVHPTVVQAMRQHVRDMGPGTAASARYNGLPPPTSP